MSKISGINMNQEKNTNDILVKFSEVTKQYGDLVVLDKLNLDIKNNESSNIDIGPKFRLWCLEKYRRKLWCMHAPEINNPEGLRHAPENNAPCSAFVGG